MVQITAALEPKRAPVTLRGTSMALAVRAPLEGLAEMSLVAEALLAAACRSPVTVAWAAFQRRARAQQVKAVWQEAQVRDARRLRIATTTMSARSRLASWVHALFRLFPPVAPVSTAFAMAMPPPPSAWPVPTPAQVRRKTRAAPPRSPFATRVARRLAINATRTPIARPTA